MKKVKVLARIVILSIALLMTATPAAADDVKNILQFLADAKIINPKIVDASELIRCFAEHSPGQCVDLQNAANDLKSDAASTAEKKAAAFVPDDPMVKASVDIVRAALHQDWLRVLELTGVKLLGQIACTAGLAVTGPLEPFICGKFASKVLGKAEPVVHEVLVVVRDFPNVNIWKLVTLFGFDLACDIIKGEGVPLASEACGVLGQAFAALASLGGDLLGAIGDGLTAVNEFLSGGGPAMMTADEYYSRIVRPLMYKRALERLVAGRGNLGMDQEEVVACFGYGGMVYGYKCGNEMSSRLHKESEALVKLAETLPETYLHGYLIDDVQKRAISRFGMGNAEMQYVNKLPASEWDWLIDGQGVKLMVAYGALAPGGEDYLKNVWKECRYWASEKLTGDQNYGVPFYEEIAPSSLTNWICYQGAAKLFFQAQAKEEKRLAAIKAGLNKLGCPSLPGTTFSFNCQSHISFSICVNQSYTDYGENRYCKADRDKTAESLGASLVNTLGETRCRYVALSKGNFGDFDPRVQCSRPWKQQTCDALLESFRAKFEVPSSRMQMRCAYNPDKPFLAQEARAREILALLNNGPAPAMVRASGRPAMGAMTEPNSCKSLWDPLAINCPHQTKIPALPGNLASPAIASCPADPNKNGADAVCYQTTFTAGDSNTELVESQTLSPLSPAPQNLPPAASGPARTANVPRKPGPSPITATADPATALPVPAAMNVPQMTTLSGAAADEQEPAAAPPRDAAPAIRAGNAQRSEPQAPPNPCHMDVTYYVPRPPVIETSSPSLRVGDPLQVRCGFEQRTRQIEWPQCNDEAKSDMQSLKYSQESGSRYSGMMIIDGANVGLASSSLAGGSFDKTGRWIFNEAGVHEVTCQVDNGLYTAGSNAPMYLRAGVSVRVAGPDRVQEFRGFEQATARKVNTTALPAQVSPLPGGGRVRLSDDPAGVRGNDRLSNPSRQPQSEVPSGRPDEGGSAPVPDPP